MTQTVNIIPVELTELRAASTASGGTALSTTVAQIAAGTAGWGADYISLTPTNFSAACKAARVLLNPYLTIFYTKDAGVSVATTAIISDEMQDGDATDHALDDFPLTGTGYIYVGARVPFSGVAITLGDGNDDATVITVKYWQAGIGWTDISDTDGTDVGGDSMKQNGSVTWTVPTTWGKKSLSNMGETLPNTVPKFYEALYWTRWEWSAALDASIDVRTMLAINRATTYAELIEGQTLEVKASDREIGNVQAITSAGTCNLIANVGTLIGSEFE
jgi:hypothetical protein